VTGIDAAIAALKTAHPSLFVAAPTAVAATGTAPAADASPPPPASVLGMNPAEYASAKSQARERLRRQGS
jgi:hypothetical protein